MMFTTQLFRRATQLVAVLTMCALAVPVSVPVFAQGIPEARLTITASVTPEEAYPGEQVRVSYVIRNDTEKTFYLPEEVSDRHISDPLPPWLTRPKTELHGDGLYDATSDRDGDGVLGEWVFQTQAIAPGDVRVFNFQAVVPEDAEPNTYNHQIGFSYQTAASRGTNGITVIEANLPWKLNVIDQQTLSNNLSLTGRMTPAYAEPNESVEVEYTLSAVRDASLANGGKLTGFVPSWVQATSLVATSSTNATVTCDIHACSVPSVLHAGDAFTFVVKGSVRSTVDPGTTYTHDWQVEETGQVSGHVISAYQVRLTQAILGGAPKLDVLATVSPNVVAPGEDVRYQFVVTNTETIFAPSDTTLLAKLPEGIVFDTSNISSSGADENGTAVFDASTGLFDITHFTPGEAYTLSIKAHAANGLPASTVVYPVTLTHIYALEGIPVDFTVVDEAVASLGVKPNDPPQPSGGSPAPEVSRGAIALSSDKVEVEVGEEVTLTTQVFLRDGQNLYTSDIVVTQELPVGLEVTSVSSRSLPAGHQGAYTEDARISYDQVTHAWRIAKPDAGDSFELVLKTKVTDAAEAALVDTATLIYSQPNGEVRIPVSISLSVKEQAPMPPSGGSGGGAPAPFEPPPAPAPEEPSGRPVHHSHGGGGSRPVVPPAPEGSAVEYEVYLRNKETGTITRSSDWNAGIVPGGSLVSGTLAFEPEADSLKTIFFNDVYFSYYSTSCTASGFWLSARQTTRDYQVGLRVYEGNVVVKDMILFENLEAASGVQRVVDFGALIGKPCTSAKVRSSLLPETCQPASCEDIGLYLALVNPDNTVRETLSPFARITRHGGRMFTIAFEDKGVDMDFNDVILDLDVSSCSALTSRQVALDASWHHQIRANLTYKGQAVRHLLLSADSQKTQGSTVQVNAFDYIQCAR